MQMTTRRSSVGIPHLFCPVEGGSNPEGDRDPPNVPKTPFMREREREREWDAMGEERRGEREREWGTKGKERREGERERGQERGQERDPQSKSWGLTGAKGGWWVRVDKGVWDAVAAQSSLMVKQRGAMRPWGTGTTRRYVSENLSTTRAARMRPM